MFSFQALKKIGHDKLILLLCVAVFLSYLPEAGEYSCFFVYLRLVSISVNKPTRNSTLRFNDETNEKKLFISTKKNNSRIYDNVKFIVFMIWLCRYMKVIMVSDKTSKVKVFYYSVKIF